MKMKGKRYSQLVSWPHPPPKKLGKTQRQATPPPRRLWFVDKNQSNIPQLGHFKMLKWFGALSDMSNQKNEHITLNGFTYGCGFTGIVSTVRAPSYVENTVRERGKRKTNFNLA